MTFITDIVSTYVHEAEISAIKEMAMRSAKVAGAASLTWGLPSFRTPEFIREAVKTGQLDPNHIDDMDMDDMMELFESLDMIQE